MGNKPATGLGAVPGRPRLLAGRFVRHCWDRRSFRDASHQQPKPTPRGWPQRTPSLGRWVRQGSALSPVPGCASAVAGPSRL